MSPRPALHDPAKEALIAFVRALARRQAQIDAIEAGEATIEDCDVRPPRGELRPLFNRAAK